MKNYDITIDNSNLHDAKINRLVNDAGATINGRVFDINYINFIISIRKKSFYHKKSVIYFFFLDIYFDKEKKDNIEIESVSSMYPTLKSFTRFVN